MSSRDRLIIIIFVVALLAMAIIGVLRGLNIGADSGQIFDIPPDLNLSQ